MVIKQYLIKKKRGGLVINLLGMLENFYIDNRSSLHSDNRKKNLLVLGENPTGGINGNFGSAEKTFCINFSKASLKFCLSLHYNGDNSYFFL